MNRLSRTIVLRAQWVPDSQIDRRTVPQAVLETLGIHRAQKERNSSSRAEARGRPGDDVRSAGRFTESRLVAGDQTKRERARLVVLDLLGKPKRLVHRASSAHKFVHPDLNLAEVKQRQNPIRLVLDSPGGFERFGDQLCGARNVTGFALRLGDRSQGMGELAAVHDCPRCGQSVPELAGR